MSIQALAGSSDLAVFDVPDEELTWTVSSNIRFLPIVLLVVCLPPPRTSQVCVKHISPVLGSRDPRPYCD